MSLKTTKEHLGRLLADKDVKVLALSGKWGTGKSFMWNQIKASSRRSEIQSSLYASLFGLSSVEQIKMKLIQSVVPAAKKSPALWATAKKAVQSSIKVLEGFHEGFAALNDVGLLFAPTLMKEKLVVLDDIERKHAELNIDEVLGFIDEYSQQHETRFLLILNDDQLKDREVWSLLREKVIDQELRLNTTPEEAFEIAVAAKPSRFANEIRSSVDACGLTNIRVIRKVIGVVNRVLENHRKLSPSVLSRVVPSTVLLSGIHYRGIEDGPDFAYVLAQGALRGAPSAAAKAAESNDEIRSREAKWQLLLKKLGVVSCDSFELLVVEFLESGLFDVSRVDGVIGGYVAHDSAQEAQAECRDILYRFFWDHTATEEQLLSEASKLENRADLLDAHLLSLLCQQLESVAGGDKVANASLDKWIRAFRTRQLDDIDPDNPYRLKVHPRIEAEFNRIDKSAQARTSVLDACLHVVKHSGWGTRQSVAMRSASIDDFEKTIRASSISDLKSFMTKMIELCIQKQGYVLHFGSAMDNFLAACRKIIKEEESSRLARLIQRLFADCGMPDLLKSPAPTSPQ